MDEILEVCGYSIPTCQHGTRVQVYAIRKAMGEVSALLVFGRLNEIGQPLLDGGILVGRVRDAIEHVERIGGFATTGCA